MNPAVMIAVQILNSDGTPATPSVNTRRDGGVAQSAGGRS